MNTYEEQHHNSITYIYIYSSEGLGEDPESDNSLFGTGAVYVFERSGGEC
jgi:hypothetical protein